MNTPLRVLLVAPSTADAGPALEELRRAGHEISWEIVRSVEMERSVEPGAWDLVLWIPEEPGSEPEDALALSASAGFDAPFLVVSDGENENVRRLRSDADGALPRIPLPRLAVTVERRLAEVRLRRERRESREALRESESRFRTFADGSRDLTLTVNAEGLVLFANRAAERIFGHPIPAMIGRPVARLLPGLAAPGSLESSSAERTPQAEPTLSEQTGIHASGREIPLEVSVATFRRNGRRLVTIVGRDVSERNLVHQALRRSEARHAAMSEAALDAIVTIDGAGTVLEFNASAERTFGYSREKVLGRPMADLIVPPALRERHRRGMERYLSTGEAAILGRRIEMTAMRADGSEIPVELTVTRVPSEGPAIFTACLRDISDRRRAEAALRESEERFRVAAQISSDYVYEWNVETGEVLFLHSRHGSRQGVPRTREEWEDLVHPKDRARVLESVRRTLETDQPFFEEYRVVLPGGSVRYRLGYGKVLREPGGRDKWIGVDKDVTERKRTQSALKESEQKLRTLVTNMPVVLFAVDREGTFTHSEGKGLHALGLKPGEVVGQRVWDTYAKYPDVLEHIRRALDGEAHTATVRVDEIAFETRYAPYRDAGGHVIGVIGVATDVTEQRLADEKLRASEARYRTLFERNLAGVFRSNLEGQILDCNESFARMFGYESPEEVLARPARNFYLQPAERQDFLARLAEHRSLTNFELCARRRDGTPVWVLENATLVEGPDGALSLIEGTVIDITERKRAEEQVKHLAFHDALTGLPNRLLLNDRLTIALAQAHRGRHKLATLYLDLDRFKVINDSLGHTVGDALLRRVAERLRSCLREGDTVARLGGDEFVILLSKIADEKDAETVSRKVLAAIRLPFAVEERDFFLTTSIGMSIHPNDGATPETLLQNADTAMYRAKEQGRDNYQLYAPEMNARASERLSLENRLRQALPGGELVLHYQPIVDLKSGRVRGAEALLRWRHPERGLLLPAEFITLAELSGLIAPIGQWVLQNACAQIREWQRRGHRLTVSVNLSPRQFQQADLVSQVAAALEANGVEAGLLDLEITESSAMENAELTIRTLWDLRRLGVGISMDDFGTGYSSLNYLKRFPIDRVKLDRSFVRDVVTNSEDAAIVRAVIAMAHTLNLIVVAEGVENEDQLSFLRKHRCDEMQGFLFSRPVDTREFLELLDRRPSVTAIA